MPAPRRKSSAGAQRKIGVKYRLSCLLYRETPTKLYLYALSRTIATFMTTQAAQQRLIDYSVEAGVALVTLNDPPANTYSYEMMQQLDARILEARTDESVQVIVIIGAGEKFFCAGANRAMLSEVTPEFKYYFCLHANEPCRPRAAPKLVIAASTVTVSVRF